MGKPKDDHQRQPVEKSSGAHRGEGPYADQPAHRHTVRNGIRLVDQVPQHQGDGEAEQQAQGRSAGHGLGGFHAATVFHASVLCNSDFKGSFISRAIL